ncbi:hypothetical protein A2Y99_03075 [Candidatus Gottesmanbacteria bacterium RBG_13_37_7]|uniref:Superoxide dismutase n=1 Tax=Candidatus Gottesmanbacteria bacterium RBG_13_37_7 TaxID=1798369 RepID=A0A1F5YJ09_9BACT|nr:MAG: hypothetical protein A2Y99_03075 [Candidatus Gottesmanbacteria bacterium RBG_13_37_7]
MEPHIDGKTVELHYGKHHATYLNNLNTVLKKYPQLAEQKIEDLLGRYDSIPMDEKDKLFFRNNAGGFINHNLYWQNMDPNNKSDTKLKNKISNKFGSIEQFKAQFSEIAVKHFASGWAWLVENQSGELEYYTLPNQDSPFLRGHTPIVTLDLWEHAYYLKYQNRRIEYIEAWWKVIKII